MKKIELMELSNFIEEIPSIKTIDFGYYKNNNWWIKIKIDISNNIVWNVVQELGHILNYISTNEKLPTIFYPVSPPPYMNGGPNDFLSWIIESKESSFSPINALEWLKGRLPNPVDDLSLWNSN
ncbi:MAG: hypothetical protein PHF46_03085 [Candidatus Gracilibacteria bacterium]|nr:hypothetical protein [Candidatus Gracilibacteria bacterium]